MVKKWAVPPDVLQKLQALAAKQDQNARVMGHLAMEHGDAEIRLIAQVLSGEGNRKELFEKLGAVQFQYIEARTQFMGAVWQTKEEQKKVGEEAMRILGLPVEKEEFTVRLEDGAVLKLVTGEYVEEF